MTEPTQSNETATETATGTSTKSASGRASRKNRIGVVVSNKMTKTVVVLVERRMKHGQYGKFLIEKKKYKVHDETCACKPGDTVRIIETRPMSKEKRWRVSEIVTKAESAPEKAEG